MDIKFNSTSTWPITRESRKMRTTRGPGFTDLKVSVRLHMTGADRHRFTHPFSSRHGLTVGEALTDSRNFVPALLELAGGLVEDARAQAKAKIDYDAKRQQLSTHLANETVNIAVDLISQACTQYGVDEEDLRRAVDGTLEMKTLTLMGM